MKMQEEDKKDKIKCTVLAWKQNAHFNQISTKLNSIISLKLKIEILINPTMEFKYIKDWEDKML